MDDGAGARHNLMNGDLLMKGLLLFYLILAGVFLYEGNWPKALYWWSAATITMAILWMK